MALSQLNIEANQMDNKATLFTDYLQMLDTTRKVGDIEKAPSFETKEELVAEASTFERYKFAIVQNSRGRYTPGFTLLAPATSASRSLGGLKQEEPSVSNYICV